MHPAGYSRLFVYGTLQDERVIRAVTGKVFASEPAILRGYRRYRVKDADYPGIKLDATGSVEGLLLQKVDSDSLRKLDAFEGEYYTRLEVDVELALGEVCRCTSYVIHSDWIHLLSEDAWTLEEFQHTGYQRFRDTYPNF